MPDDTPVITPVDAPTLTLPLTLLQTPPPMASDSVILEPVHTVTGPEIADGFAFTVATAEAVHPVAVFV